MNPTTHHLISAIESTDLEWWRLYAQIAAAVATIIAATVETLALERQRDDIRDQIAKLQSTLYQRLEPEMDLAKTLDPATD